MEWSLYWTYVVQLIIALVVVGVAGGLCVRLLSASWSSASRDLADIEREKWEAQKTAEAEKAGTRR